MRLLGVFCLEDRPHLVVTADSSMLVRAQHDAALCEILADADLVLPDSIGVVWASRMLGAPLRERVTGVDVVDKLCGYCATAGLSVFLLGSAPGVAHRAGESLKARYPGLLLAGSHHGFFGDSDEPAVLAEISRAAPQVLLVAMGIPRQEKWLAKHLGELPVRVGIGVGGSLDVLSGAVRRAPTLFRRTNLEWLWRVLSDPRRARKTVLLPLFVVLVLRQRLSRPVKQSAGPSGEGS
jgi:N-acetylglucosaminyldiphosphoundecaprenol N-acetyl-beta-D-mannosaminyltransferase